MTADVFCQKESGLFETVETPEEILDEMNVKALKGEYNSSIIQALTSALEFSEMFDFYLEMKTLMEMCPFDGIARPYPLTGFRSPVVFICRDTLHECEHLESSVKAINLTQEQGDLQIGGYSRCKLTTPKLLSFYKEHYKEIKASSFGEKK